MTQPVEKSETAFEAAQRSAPRKRGAAGSPFIQNYVRCTWEARAETPRELAVRFMRMLEALAPISPIFHAWDSFDSFPKNCETPLERFAQGIAERVVRDGSGNPLPQFGYQFSVYTPGEPKGGSFIVGCHPGSTAKIAFPNEVTLATFGRNPDPKIVDYELTRAALLALVDAWEPVRASAFSNQLFIRSRKADYFRSAWIQYLCPWLAEKIMPPSTVLTENLPDGGLLMTATTETFDVKNRAHLSAAHDICAAMAPLDKLPWPPKT